MPGKQVLSILISLCLLLHVHSTSTSIPEALRILANNTLSDPSEFSIEEDEFKLSQEEEEEQDEMHPLQAQCILIWRDYAFAGPGVPMCTSGTVPPGWNDQISAITIPQGIWAVVYWDINYGGNSLILSSDWKFDQNPAWNDQITSIRILKQI